MIRTYLATLSYMLTKWCSYALAGLSLVHRFLVVLALIVAALVILVPGRFIVMPVISLIRNFMSTPSRRIGNLSQ